MEILNISGYKLKVSSISGISEIESLPNSYVFNIYCGGKIPIYCTNLEELENKRNTILKLWKRHINYSDSIIEITI